VIGGHVSNGNLIVVNFDTRLAILVGKQLHRIEVAPFAKKPPMPRFKLEALGRTKIGISFFF
jgi:hypothetical protein